VAVDDPILSSYEGTGSSSCGLNDDFDMVSISRHHNQVKGGRAAFYPFAMRLFGRRVCLVDGSACNTMNLQLPKSTSPGNTIRFTGDPSVKFRIKIQRGISVGQFSLAAFYDL
jgi:hypothetical protein